jgi:hypothetical protein
MMDNNELDATLKLFQDVIMEERQRCLKAIEDEPEWNENTPEHYGVLEKMFKANLIKETKKNIRKRIEEGL